MLGQRELSIRWLFVLVLFGGSLLPMGVLGYWLTRTAARSGEGLLRARLEESLLETTREVGTRWIGTRSLLLDVSEHPGLTRLTEAGITSPPELPADLSAAVAAVAPSLVRLSVHAPSGSETARLYPGPDESRTPEPWIGVSVPVYHPVTSDRIGSVRARVRWSALTRGQNPAAAAADALLAVRSSEDGRVIVAGVLDPELMARGRFGVGDETWVGATRTIAEPALELLMAAPLDPFQRPFQQAARTGTIVLALVGTGSLLLVILLTGRLTSSLGRLAEAADAVAGGDLTERVPEEGGRELSHLAAAFNAMTDRLRATLQRLATRESLAAVGEFAASLSHEVRNPLSSVRLDLQMAREEIGDGDGHVFVDRALRSVERIDRTVTGALRIARSGRVERRDLDLIHILDGALHGAEGALESRGLAVVRSASLPDTVPLRGDAAALEQLLLNLLLNAAQAAREAVSITVEARPDEVVIEIRDDGPGIPHEMRDRVFEPFVTTRRDGTGLGLAMARSIAEAHGGQIAVGDVPEGTSIRVRLPRNGA